MLRFTAWAWTAALLLPALAGPPGPKSPPSFRKAEAQAQEEPDWAQCGLVGGGAKERIVHGTDSQACLWRWQVSLSSESTGQFCGGTLIAPDWVLTAAHCVAHVREKCGLRTLKVGAGTSKREARDATALEERNVARIYVHPMNNGNVPHDYDFALLKLDRAMPLNECIGVACLPDTPEKIGEACTITGWGTLASRGSTPEILQEASVALLNRKDCEVNYTKYDQTITGSMLCASGRSNRGITDTCQGDSGGPLVCQEDGVFVLRGVTSWGQGCALSGFPGIYARVHSVLAWVDDVLNDKVKRANVQDSEEKEDVSGIDFQGAMWSVVSGLCTVDESDCILSPNFPGNYPPSGQCKIVVNASGAVPISVENFSTEASFDILSFDCKAFSGEAGPEGIVPDASIFWAADHSIASSGWRLCPAS